MLSSFLIFFDEIKGTASDHYMIAISPTYCYMYKRYGRTISMLRYETLILARPEITQDELSLLESQFDKFVSASSNGKLSSFDRWGKYRLCFPVAKNEYGVYILARYELNGSEKLGSIFKDLDTFLKIKCNEFVMRHVHIKLAKNAPSLYQKPEALDSSRSANIDSFLKENKVESLLNSVDAASSHDEEGEIEPSETEGGTNFDNYDDEE